MVHVRLNEKESNPNAHINFITPLPADDEDDARQLLRAFAAQVRPIMKQHGFVINSFEEYEHNSVFAGRNWNNGETVELVLRRPGGSFLPSHWLMSVLCHELAHISHMNHGPDFQALWKQLRLEVRQLQDKGYYGDGYWSSGKRLVDSAKISGDGVETGELPEYMCGGAQTRSRPSRSRRRGLKRRPQETVASNKTGRQTAKKRKAGGRVTSKYAFEGQGVSLQDAGSSQGTGFGKQAGRALAAEKRLRLLQGSSSVERAPVEEDNSSEGEDETENDADRKNTLSQTDQAQDLDELRFSWNDFKNDFVFTGNGRAEVIDISTDEEDVPPPTIKGKDKEKRNLVESEVYIRKKEALGMASGSSKNRLKEAPKDGHFQPDEWDCKVCTLLNKPGHLACGACGTPRNAHS
ncbi:WLM-domain-containing protein [Hymenopellis radicata]|nr:WLM-domain-containing protein [Hymenopellis radicata]